jgi:hypothetical protein
MKKVRLHATTLAAKLSSAFQQLSCDIPVQVKFTVVVVTLINK